jgi:hypothetical protein
VKDRRRGEEEDSVECSIPSHEDATMHVSGGDQVEKVYVKRSGSSGLQVPTPKSPTSCVPTEAPGSDDSDPEKIRRSKLLDVVSTPPRLKKKLAQRITEKKRGKAKGRGSGASGMQMKSGHKSTGDARRYLEVEQGMPLQVRTEVTTLGEQSKAAQGSIPLSEDVSVPLSKDVAVTGHTLQSPSCADQSSIPVCTTRLLPSKLRRPGSPIGNSQLIPERPHAQGQFEAVAASRPEFTPSSAKPCTLGSATLDSLSLPSESTLQQQLSNWLKTLGPEALASVIKNSAQVFQVHVSFCL